MACTMPAIRRVSVCNFRCGKYFVAQTGERECNMNVFQHIRSLVDDLLGEPSTWMMHPPQGTPGIRRVETWKTEMVNGKRVDHVTYHHEGRDGSKYTTEGKIEWE